MKTHRVHYFAGLLLTVWLMSGCTTKLNYVKARNLGGFTGSERLPLPVELRLSAEYRQAKWEMDFMGKTVLPIGGHLVTNTVGFAQAIFANVLVTTNQTDSPISPNASAILIPRLVYLDMSGASIISGYITIAMEWSVFDSGNNLVWVDSYRSEFRGLPQGVRGAKQKLQRKFDIILADLFKQSQIGMLSSPELRKFSQKSLQVGAGN